MKYVLNNQGHGMFTCKEDCLDDIVKDIENKRYVIEFIQSVNREQCNTDGEHKAVVIGYNIYFKDIV